MRDRTWLDRLSSPVAAGLILFILWLVLIASLRDKSLTSDEPVHAAGGYSYWKFDDYRVNPENGNLPQRWMAIPLVAGGYHFPSLDSEAWRRGDEWALANEWLYHIGNDVPGMLLRGRAMMGLLTVALGGLVWWWSRRLFGPTGGLLTLLLFALDPSILANGALMTSDMACALFFLASVLCVWSVLHRVTVGRVLVSGLVVGGLFVTKMSAILIVPIALTLACIRLFAGPPPTLEMGSVRSLSSRSSRIAVFAGIAGVHLILLTTVIWAFYGFRYSAFSPASPAGTQFGHPWAEVLGSAAGAPATEGSPATARVIGFLRDHRILPEGYLYGAAHAWKYSRLRSAFLNGQFSITGWRWFFPYTVLVKTPLPVFGALLLALIALRRRPSYETIPLWILFGFYWAAAIANPLNIGHRHVLTTYPPFFILCGAAAYWMEAPRRDPSSKVGIPFAGWIVWGLTAVLAMETAVCFPNYLAYFNILAGGPANGYRHLVDSSLDWGQDLPNVKRYIEAHHVSGPTYISYFGTASLDYYKVPAKYLFSIPGMDVSPPVQLLEFPVDEIQAKLGALIRLHPEYDVAGGARGAHGRAGVMLLQSAEALRLGPGTYFISATMLQPIMYELTGPIGPWNLRYEKNYQILYSAVKPLLDDDPAVRAAALPKKRPSEWRLTLAYFDMYRFARLTSYLRHLQPIGNVNDSILVYRLGESDISRAIDGPPPELGIDLPAASGMVNLP